MIIRCFYLFLEPFPDGGTINITDFFVWNFHCNVNCINFKPLPCGFQVSCKKQKIPKIVLRFVDVFISNIFIHWFFNRMSRNQSLNFLFHAGIRNFNECPNNIVRRCVGPVWFRKTGITFYHI